MSSVDILLNNLKRHYAVNSTRALASKLNLSESVVLNWSSKRSSPSIKQINEIAYILGVDVAQLLIPNNIFNIYTPIWKDDIEKIVINNLGKLKLEQEIYEEDFYVKASGVCTMGYRTFLRYINGKNKTINLDKLDNLAKILSVDTYQLLERVNKNEKKDKN